MAKRRRAFARKKRRSPSPCVFAAELLADGRRRYEQTSESLDSIAVNFGIHRTTFMALARREGWVRHVPVPRKLPPTARLSAEVEALEASTSADSKASGAPAAENPVPGNAGDIERIYRSLMAELAAAVEALRMRIGTLPAIEAERMARTIATLTETLHSLQPMRCATPENKTDDAQPYDDMPLDIDQFRIDLARRIDAFVASRTKPGDADGDAAAPVAAGQS